MSEERKNISDALALGNVVGERTGYYLDAHSAENHPGQLTEALCPEPADWFRKYANLSKRLKEFKNKYREVRKTIANNVCDGELKLVSHDDVKDYFLADPDLKEMWMQHNADIDVCFKLLRSYEKYKFNNKKYSLLDFSLAYLKRLIEVAEEKFGQLYFDDTHTEVVEVIEQPINNKVEKKVEDVKFEVKHFRMIYIRYFDEDPYVPLTEPFYLNDNESVEDAIERFKRDWKGCYNENCCITCSDVEEFDKKVRIWED